MSDLVFRTHTQIISGIRHVSSQWLVNVYSSTNKKFRSVLAKSDPTDSFSMRKRDA